MKQILVHCKSSNNVDSYVNDSYSNVLELRYVVVIDVVVVVVVVVALVIVVAFVVVVVLVEFNF